MSTAQFQSSSAMMGPNASRYAVGFVGGLLLLAGVIALFYYLLKKDGEDTKKDSEGMHGVPTQAAVRQPAMVSLDGLASTEIGRANENVRTNMSNKLEDSSTTQYYPKVNLNPAAVNLNAPRRAVTDPAERGNLVRNVTDLTRDQGVVQQISVDGKKVPREVVEYGMFENHEFYPRTNEFPIHEKPHFFDPAHKAPKSHFGPMTYPLVGPIGALGMDVMKAGARDTRVNIAATGGRH